MNIVSQSLLDYSRNNQILTSYIGYIELSSKYRENDLLWKFEKYKKQADHLTLSL